MRAAAKRGRAEGTRFAGRLGGNLADMADRLRTGTFPFGRFTQFIIRDPKERVITASRFAERVAHHALIAACGMDDRPTPAWLG